MDGEKDRIDSAAADLTVPVGDLCRTPYTISPETPVSRVKEIFAGEEPVAAVVVVEKERPVGLIMSIHLDRTLSQRYGFSLFYRRPVSAVMDRAFMAVERDAPLEAVSTAAMARPMKSLYDNIVVTEGRALFGIVSVRRLLEAMVVQRQIRARKLEQANRELRKAMAEVKTLSGLLPICAHCKKIRDDKGYWNQIETYISENSGADFSHGICPDCARTLYPEVFARKEAREKD